MLTRAIQLASKDAEELGVEIACSQLLLEVLGTDSVASLLEGQSIAIEPLKSALASVWKEAMEHAAPVQNAGQLSEQARVLVMDAAIACASADLAQAEPEHVLLQALRPEAAASGLRELLQEYGLSLYEMRRAIAHGHTVAIDPEPLTGSVDVTFYNDPFTTREFVVEALVDTFGLDERRAQDLMLAIHNDCSGVVASLDARDAAICLTELRERARVQAYPLRAVARTASSKQR